MAENRLTQEAVEAVIKGGSGALLVTQEALETIQSGTPYIIVTQELVEAVWGANPSIQNTQLIIEVVFSRSKGGRRFRAQVMG